MLFAILTEGLLFRRRAVGCHDHLRLLPPLGQAGFIYDLLAFSDLLDFSDLGAGSLLFNSGFGGGGNAVERGFFFYRQKLAAFVKGNVLSVTIHFGLGLILGLSILNLFRNSTQSGVLGVVLDRLLNSRWQVFHPDLLLSGQGRAGPESAQYDN